MRVASSLRCLASLACLLAGNGCEAPLRDEHVPPSETLAQGSLPKHDQNEGAPLGVSASQGKGRAAGGGQAGSPAAGQTGAKSAKGDEPYIGDVPARAASSGNRPCGSSEFSVGPCGGQPASMDVGVDAGTPASSTRVQASQSLVGCQVGAVPDSVRESYQLDPFYKKYANASGIPVLASDKPVDRSLELACLLVDELTSKRSDVRAALIASKVTFAIVGTGERTTEIPEYRDLPDYYDMRARGLGGHTGLCAEESILCDRHNDKWRGESICVHEYSHTVAIYGLFAVDDTFEGRLADAFSHAQQAGLWRDTFAAQDAQEYWAEGVQDWYYTNIEADPADGVHGPVNTKHELEGYDPALYKLIDKLLPSETKWPDCYRSQP
jgi:hypothetical protein